METCPNCGIKLNLIPPITKLHGAWFEVNCGSCGFRLYTNRSEPAGSRRAKGE